MYFFGLFVVVFAFCFVLFLEGAAFLEGVLLTCLSFIFSSYHSFTFFLSVYFCVCLLFAGGGGGGGGGAHNINDCNSTHTHKNSHLRLNIDVH